MELLNLDCVYDNRKSFYDKAKVFFNGVNSIKLYSYDTLVCEIDKENNKAVVYGSYSVTTLRHIKEFLKQNGFRAVNKKQILEDYEVKK